VAGGKAKYYKHLRDWNRLSAGDAKRLQGVTGASVGAGRTLKVTADLADALIDAGYEIRIDAAVEDMRDSPSEVRVPLTAAGAGKAQAGKQYIQSFELSTQINPCLATNPPLAGPGGRHRGAGAGPDRGGALAGPGALPWQARPTPIA
jgi:hypothetical protein